MSDTPICDANYIDSEPHGYQVVPLHIAQKLERGLAEEKQANAKHFAENNRRFDQLHRAITFELELRCKAQEELKQAQAKIFELEMLLKVERKKNERACKVLEMKV